MTAGTAAHGTPSAAAAGSPSPHACSTAGGVPGPAAGTGAGAGAADAGHRTATERAAVARGGVANLVGGGVAAVCGVGVTWVVARGLPPAAAGAFFAATAAFTLVGGVAKLGTATSLVYWPARLRASGQHALLRDCLRTGLAPVAAAAVLLGLALWWAAPAVARLTVGQHPQALAAALRALAVFVPAVALTEALLAATRGYRAMRPTVVVERVARPALQLAGVGALAVADVWRPVPLWAYAVAWASPYVPAALAAAHQLRRVHRRRSRPDAAAGAPVPATPVPGTPAAGTPVPGTPAAGTPAAGTPVAGTAAAPAASTRWDAAPVGVALTRATLPRRFWAFAAPRAVASVLQLALQRVDVLLVAALGGLGAAAGYAVAGRFVVAGQLANQAISVAVQPRLAEALAVGDTARARQLYQTATGWLVFATWPLYLLVAVFAPLYLGLFGAAYTGGGAVVAVLAAAMLLATACGMVDMVLAMGGRTRWNLLNVCAALATLVGVGVAAIPRFGALGAALGLACAVAVNNLLPLAQVWRALRVHPFGAGTLSAAGLAAVSCGAVPAAAAALWGRQWWVLLGALAAGAAVHAAGGWALRGPLALDAVRMLRPRADRGVG